MSRPRTRVVLSSSIPEPLSRHEQNEILLRTIDADDGDRATLVADLIKRHGDPLPLPVLVCVSDRGFTAADDHARIISAWHRARRGEQVEPLPTPQWLFDLEPASD